MIYLHGRERGYEKIENAIRCPCVAIVDALTLPFGSSGVALLSICYQREYDRIEDKRIVPKLTLDSHLQYDGNEGVRTPELSLPFKVLGAHASVKRLWRRGRDSNPRYGCPYAAFRVRCIRPLCHLSVPKTGRGGQGVSAPKRVEPRPISNEPCFAKPYDGIFIPNAAGGCFQPRRHSGFVLVTARGTLTLDP